MSALRRGTRILWAAAGLLAGAAAMAADLEAIEANRRAYRLEALEKRTSEMQVTQVVLRQRVLDAGPELSRKTCDDIAARLKDPEEFKYLRKRVRELKKESGKFTPEQVERFSAVQARLARLEQDASLDCRALAPINP